jgi:hypothetical protein
MQFEVTATDACRSPSLWLAGDFDEPEFGDAMAMLYETANTTRCADIQRAGSDGPRDSEAPELIIYATSRPGAIRALDVVSLRRRFPLARLVALLGNWCEGETRTGRPVPGMQRVFWYDFANWWRRQLALREAGRCPDWALPPAQDSCPVADIGGGIRQIEPRGMILLATTCWETGEALTAVLRSAGYATAWCRTGGTGITVSGAIAGIWEGRMLDAAELGQLSEFCVPLNRDGTPVIALADFPRFDRCEAAKSAGAAVVIAKPWLNVDLLATIEGIPKRQTQLGDDRRVARAA